MHTHTHSNTCTPCISHPFFQRISFLRLLENIATGFDHNEIQVGDLAQEPLLPSVTRLQFLLFSCSPPVLYSFFLFFFLQDCNKLLFGESYFPVYLQRDHWEIGISLLANRPFKFTICGREKRSNQRKSSRNEFKSIK